MLIVERWILAWLRNRRFFSLADLNAAIAVLLEDVNNRPMRHVGKSRREMFEEIERTALSPLPPTPFEYAEWKSAEVHPDYHVEVDRTFYSAPHGLGPLPSIICTLELDRLDEASSAGTAKNGTQPSYCLSCSIMPDDIPAADPENRAEPTCQKQSLPNASRP